MALSLSLAELVNDVDDDGIIDRFVLLLLIDRLARSQLSPVSVSELRVPSTADLSTDCHCHFQSLPPPLNFITFAETTISATDGQSGVSEQMMADQLQDEKISRGKLGRSSTAGLSSAPIANTRTTPICSIVVSAFRTPQILGGKYSEDDAKEVMVQILSVVSYCHLQGVVHRDLKPEMND